MFYRNKNKVVAETDADIQLKKLKLERASACKNLENAVIRFLKVKCTLEVLDTEEIKNLYQDEKCVLNIAVEDYKKTIADVEKFVESHDPTDFNFPVINIEASHPYHYLSVYSIISETYVKFFNEKY